MILLKAKRNVRGLSKPERTLLYALNDLNKLKNNLTIPHQQEIDSRRVMDQVLHRNYYSALYLQEGICHRKGIKLDDNNLYVVINNICNIISNNDSNADSITRETDSPLNYPDTKAVSIPSTTRTITKKISDQVLN